MRSRARVRTLWPTREGWWWLAGATAVGIAAVNSGNTLLYLLVSLVLALIIVSGMVSENSLRGLRVSVSAPGDVYAGRPALLSLSIANEKRWAASYSLRLEGLDGAPPAARVPVLPPRSERILLWETTLARRGRQALPALHVTTRFPFGLFRKAGARVASPEVVVFPAPVPLAAERRSGGEGDGERAARRRGRGHELYALREYVTGDDPRLIHWRSSAKAAALVVRDLEAPLQLDTRIVLVGSGVRDEARRERGLSEAAWLATELIDGGAAVELTGPGVFVPVAAGVPQARRLLTALALFDADAAVGAAGPPPHSGARLREVRITLG